MLVISNKPLLIRFKQTPTQHEPLCTCENNQWSRFVASFASKHQRAYSQSVGEADCTSRRTQKARGPVKQHKEEKKGKGLSVDKKQKVLEFLEFNL
jgi:hypothetical protein